MDTSPSTVIVAIVVLTAFLIFITALKYAVANTFLRSRLIMTAFFLFIVTTLTISFWEYALVSVPYSVPALLVGIVVGRVVAVREAERKLMAQGAEHYLEHFAHIHIDDLKKLRWWSIINFYTVIGALGLINLIGLSTVIFNGNEEMILLTCAVGAFGLGTLAPYLWHLWSISTTHKISAPER